MYTIHFPHLKEAAMKCKIKVFLLHYNYTTIVIYKVAYKLIKEQGLKHHKINLRTVKNKEQRHAFHSLDMFTATASQF